MNDNDPTSFEIDERYERTNLDGTKEYLRFVKYPQDREIITRHYNKIRKTSATFASMGMGIEADGYVWESLISETSEILMSDFVADRKIMGEGYDSRIEKIIKSIKKLFNENSNSRKQKL